MRRAPSILRPGCFHPSTRKNQWSVPRQGPQERFLGQISGVPTAIFAATTGASIEAFGRPHVQELQRRGYSVIVVANSDGATLDELTSSWGAGFHDVPMQRSVAVVSDLRCLFLWFKALLLYRPVAVVTMTPKASLLGMLAAKLSLVRTRIYLSVGLRVEGERGRLRFGLLSLFERLTVACSTQVIFNSPSLRREFLKRNLCPPRKAGVVLPGSDHGVDTTKFYPIPRPTQLLIDLGLSPCMFTILYVGRIARDKGLDTLAASAAAWQGPPVQLVIAGGMDDPDSCALLNALGRSAIPVAYVGHVDDVRPYIGAAHLLVLPTLREGFPNVVLEAAAMAVPCITTTATGAVDSVIDGQTGFLVPPSSPKALGECIRQAASDPEGTAQIGLTAQAYVSEHFSELDILQRLYNLVNWV